MEKQENIKTPGVSPVGEKQSESGMGVVEKEVNWQRDM